MNFLNISFVDWIAKNLEEPEYFACDPKRWDSLFGCICWHLWIRRNKYILNAELMQTKSILEKSYWMRDTSLKMKHVLKQAITCRDNGARMEKRWHPPEDGQMKVNTDGAVCQFSSIATVGGLICNKFGVWVSGFTRNIGSCSILMAELQGILDDLQIAWNLGLKKVVIKTDSKEAIQAIQETSKEHYGSTVARSIMKFLTRD